jgi:hypothetical protein
MVKRGKDVEWTSIISPLLYPILHEVLKDAVGDLAKNFIIRRFTALRNWLRKKADEKTAQRFLDAESVRLHPSLYDYLKHRLTKSRALVAGRPAELLQRKLNGQILHIPVCLISKHVKLAPWKDVPVRRAEDWENSEFVRLQRRLGRVIEDNTTFEATKIDVTASHAELTGGLTTYGSCLSSQDALEWELLSKMSELLREGAPYPSEWTKLDELLKKRSTIESLSNQYLLNNAGRYNAIGISTLIVYKDKCGEYKVLLGKRGEQTGAHPGLFHVIPSCMFQPELGHPDVEWNVLHSVFKEYGEELFNKKLDRNALDPCYFYKCWPPPPTDRCVANLREALEQGKAEFVLTGLVINVLNLRPEICALLLVKDSSWWSEQWSQMRTNWEYVNPQEVYDMYGYKSTELSLDNIEEEYVKYFGYTAGMWVPPGLAALWLGVDAARAMI